MDLKDIRNVYFIGGGGIGMAALERYFLSLGKAVGAYDRTPSDLTHELEKEGVEMTYTDSVDEIPEAFRNPADTLAVYTPAVPADNAILSFFRDGGFELAKRSAVLGAITRSSKGLCFAGTHGKTTTSSMAAHILHSGTTGCNAFLGGILTGEYNSNLILSPTSPFSVIEADEYDRSFHTLRPYVAVVTATDPDHLDIYGTEEAYLESFAHFTELIQPGGYLLVHTGLKLKPRPGEGVKTYTYSRHEGDFHAANIRRSEGRIVFDFVHPGGVIEDIELGVPVDINIDNAVAALGAVWLAVELTPELARKAVATYPGVERRFQMHLRPRKPGDRVIIDDYAHHPDELRSSIASVRALFPGRKLTVAFQPHLYSRTRDFAPEFAEALSAADSVILVDLYPAREEPIPGISEKSIYDLVKCADKEMICRQDFVNRLKNRNFEVLLTAGAGDLNLYTRRLAEELRD
ncbi:MAG: UDP-N-acetylmuramate--L-alanine ligase [Muribaculaceae bacterium]|nr:UDP-N-acetylmuramate--L-alanine ligase [Muribaculaceae bacterium]